MTYTQDLIAGGNTRSTKDEPHGISLPPTDKTQYLTAGGNTSTEHRQGTHALCNDNGCDL
eukprot:2161767-Amphidinium_carterae.1